MNKPNAGFGPAVNTQKILLLVYTSLGHIAHYISPVHVWVEGLDSESV